MAEIPPLPPTAPATTTAPVAPVVPVTPAPPLTLLELLVLRAPPHVLMPPVPVQVEGRVIASTPQTQEIRIQTAAGEVAVKSSVSLPLETLVSVKIYADKLQTLATIAALRSPIPEPEKSVRRAASLGVLSAPPPLSSPPSLPPLREGVTVTALLLPEAKPPVIGPTRISTDPSNDPVLSPEGERRQSKALPPLPLGKDRGEGTIGHEVKLTRTGIAPPASALNTLLSVVESLKSRPADILTATVGQAAPLPKNMYQMNILKVFPPETLPEHIKIVLDKLAAVPPEKPQAFPQQAKVEAVTPGGFPILKTDTSHYVLKAPVSIAIGSIVLFEASPMTAEKLQFDKSTGIPAGPFNPLASAAWPALDEALRVMEKSDPAMAQALRSTLPTPTPQLVPTALFFLAALRLGAVDGWLGDNTLRVLRDAGKKDLAETLGSDFTKLSRQSKEVLADEWRSLSMPILHDEQVSQMQFYVRQQHDRENSGREGEKKPVTRFLLNLHLSRMGEMQLDGFIQKKNFDIVLRTEEKLPFDMRQELMKRFAQGLEQVQMQGGISFQARHQGWVTVDAPHQALQANI